MEAQSIATRIASHGPTMTFIPPHLRSLFIEGLTPIAQRIRQSVAGETAQSGFDAAVIDFLSYVGKTWTCYKIRGGRNTQPDKRRKQEQRILLQRLFNLETSARTEDKDNRIDQQQQHQQAPMNLGDLDMKEDGQHQSGPAGHRDGSQECKHIIEDQLLDAPTLEASAISETTAARINTLTARGYISKAYRAAKADHTPLPLGDEVMSTLWKLHPARPDNFPCLPDDAPIVTVQNNGQLHQAIMKLAKRVAPGPSGWTAEMLKILVDNPVCMDAIAILVTRIINGSLSPLLSGIIRTSLLIPLDKGKGKGAKDPRPIAMGDIFLKLADTLLLTDCLPAITKQYLRPKQMGIATPAGTDKILLMVQEHLQGGNIVVQLDAANAFNTIDRGAIFRHLLSVKSAAPLLRRAHLQLSTPSPLLVKDVATGILKSGIKSSQGVQQGSALGSLLFCIGLHPVLEALQAQFPQVSVAAFLDDIHLFIPCGDIDNLAGILTFIRDGLAAIGLSLNMSKTVTISAPSYRPSRAHSAQFTLAGVSLPTKDAVILGVPIGSDKSIDDHVSKVCQKHRRALVALTHPSITPQTMYALIAKCLLPSMIFLLRGLDMDSHKHIVALEREAIAAFGRMLNVDLLDESHDAFHQSKLPVSLAGLGLTPFTALRHIPRLSSLATACSFLQKVLQWTPSKALRKKYTDLRDKVFHHLEINSPAPAMRQRQVPDDTLTGLAANLLKRRTAVQSLFPDDIKALDLDHYWSAPMGDQLAEPDAAFTTSPQTYLASLFVTACFTSLYASSSPSERIRLNACCTPKCSGSNLLFTAALLPDTTPVPSPTPTAQAFMIAVKMRLNLDLLPPLLECTCTKCTSKWLAAAHKVDRRVSAEAQPLMLKTHAVARRTAPVTHCDNNSSADRHNGITECLHYLMQSHHIHSTIEPQGLEPTRSSNPNKRPDLFVSFDGHLYLIDITIHNPVSLSAHNTLNKSYAAKETAKNAKYAHMARERHATFIPFVIDIFGGLAPKAQWFLHQLQKGILARNPHLVSSSADVASSIHHALSLALFMGNERMVATALSRYRPPPLPPAEDEVEDPLVLPQSGSVPQTAVPLRLRLTQTPSSL
jgi:hypothetical protein